MPNRSFLGSDVARRRVIVALALSLLIHFLVLGFMHFDLGVFEQQEDVVEVRLTNLVMPSPLEPIVEEKPKPEATSKPAKPEPEFVTEAQPIPTPEKSLEQTPSLDMVPQELSVPEALDGEGERAIPELESAPVIEATTDADALIDEGPEPFEYVETDFEILRGVDGYKIGQTKVTFQVRTDRTYLLLSESEAKGFASLFLSGILIQRSEGLISERGLQPSEFVYQYGNKDKKQRAVFDWDERKLTLETYKNMSTTRLPRDTQDLMSFMYQFMYIPPLQQMQLNITNGKRLKAYGYSFVGEVDLSTKMGAVRALHIENINDDGDEKNEIWLAVDYRFLPVKIRKTEKDGSVIEQVMTNLKTDILQ